MGGIAVASRPIPDTAISAAIDFAQSLLDQTEAIRGGNTAEARRSAAAADRHLNLLLRTLTGDPR